MLPSYIINKETLLQRFTGDQQAVREMLERFRESIPGLIVSLYGHVIESDQAAAFATVRKILSIAVCSCAITVQECAFQVQRAVIMEDMVYASEIMPLLEQMSYEAIGAINTDQSLFT